MPQLRKDLVHERWVALAQGEALKPGDFPIARQKLVLRAPAEGCPFCGGHEHMTPEAVELVPDGLSWLLRVVPNKFTAFSLRGGFEAGQTGRYAFMSSLGVHEVVIETPRHTLELQDYSAEHAASYLRLLRRRYAALAEDGRLRYIQIYKNQGMLAGATIAHSHSQVLGFPLVPDVNPGGVRYYADNRRCLLCDLLAQDLEERDRIIHESARFVLVCPYASAYPYGAWLAPKAHLCQLTDFSDAEIEEMALLLKTYVAAMLSVTDGCSYNLIMRTAPLDPDAAGGYHWYMEINPRLMIASAAEVASGIQMNPVAPEMAAVLLRARFEALYAAQNGCERA
jgi:UDPglucose--hexose-1-phosphate uridylyltransferase